MMTIRKMVMAQMAKGAELIKGTIDVTASNDKIYFGKTLPKYIYLIEMTEASKTALINTGATSPRAFSVIGQYPMPNVNNTQATKTSLVSRYQPSTQETTMNNNASIVQETTDEYIDLNANGIAGGINYFYTGYSYDYTIIRID